MALTAAPNKLYIASWKGLFATSEAREMLSCCGQCRVDVYATTAVRLVRSRVGFHELIHK